MAIDVITIKDAPSMTVGYNAGMNASNAKYKVYLHQDTFIINPNFISDFLSVFEINEKIGMMGVVGCGSLPVNANASGSWDIGKVYHNLTQGKVWGINPETENKVDAVDGLMMITQYDVPWREEIFDGWDFYDISQCYEFHRLGLDVVVPRQEECWCYHDCGSNSMKSYSKYREKFVNEYQEFGFESNKNESYQDNMNEFTLLKNQLLDQLNQMLQEKKLDEISDILDRSNIHYSAFKDINLICKIDKQEKKVENEKCIWKVEFSYQQMLNKFIYLKHLLKRIEFGCATDKDLEELYMNYSVYAICEVQCDYGIHSVLVLEKLLEKPYTQQERNILMQMEDTRW